MGEFINSIRFHFHLNKGDIKKYTTSIVKKVFEYYAIAGWIIEKNLQTAKKAFLEWVCIHISIVA